MPSSRRIACSSGLPRLAAPVELGPDLARRVGTTSGPTPSMTNSACPSSRVISAVSRSSTARWAGVCTMSSTRGAAVRVADRVGRARPRRRRSRSSRCSPPLRGVHERLHLAEEVRPHPRHGGELGAVGDLVQADPEPEVARVGAELALHLDDVRRDQQQLAGVGGEHLVLAEDPAGQVRQHGAGLHAGDPGADRARRARPAACRRRAGSTSGVITSRRPAMLVAGPVPAVDHAHRRVRRPAAQPGVVGDVPGRLVGQSPQVGDHVGGLGVATPRGPDLLSAPAVAAARSQSTNCAMHPPYPRLDHRPARRADLSTRRRPGRLSGSRSRPARRRSGRAPHGPRRRVGCVWSAMHGEREQPAVGGR